MDYKIFVADGFKGKKYKKVRNFRWEKKGIDKVKKKTTNAKFKYFSELKWCFIENSYFTRYHKFFFLSPLLIILLVV